MKNVLQQLAEALDRAGFKQKPPKTYPDAVPGSRAKNRPVRHHGEIPIRAIQRWVDPALADSLPANVVPARNSRALHRTRNAALRAGIRRPVLATIRTLGA